MVINERLHVKRELGRLLANLFEKASEIRSINSAEGLNQIVGECYDDAVESAYRRVAKKHDAVIIEGYSDAVTPLKWVEKLDSVLGVELSNVVSYDPDKYMTAVRVSSHMRREVRASEIHRLLTPIRQIRVQPFRSQEVIHGLKERIPALLLQAFGLE